MSLSCLLKPQDGLRQHTCMYVYIATLWIYMHTCTHTCTYMYIFFRSMSVHMYNTHSVKESRQYKATTSEDSYFIYQNDMSHLRQDSNLRHIANHANALLTELQRHKHVHVSAICNDALIACTLQLHAYMYLCSTLLGTYMYKMYRAKATLPPSSLPSPPCPGPTLCQAEGSD